MNIYIKEMAVLIETIDLISNKSALKDIQEADKDWELNKNATYVEWEKVKSVY
ncbi:MAG: hypothetical protein L3V56_12155 [Candidatus Magnetoovum sp. WYHC-5]|nr:hypothetical protein [Candidatus Magnetoovum sp. WYHC-5]